MSWLAWFVVVVAVLAVGRSLWAGLGAPRTWPSKLLATVQRARRRREAKKHPDPFVILQVQHRLSALASELRVLEAANADRQFYARAHRIHTRRSAYDQLLAEACALAGVPTQRSGQAGATCSSEEQRFHEEMELTARGWSW